VRNPTKHTGLILVTLMAFLCAGVLAVTRSVAARTSQNEWQITKQDTAITCETNIPVDAGSDKNNGSGCAHQLGASCLLTISGDKRNKTHSC